LTKKEIYLNGKRAYRLEKAMEDNQALTSLLEMWKRRTEGATDDKRGEGRGLALALMSIDNVKSTVGLGVFGCGGFICPRKGTPAA